MKSMWKYFFLIKCVLLCIVFQSRSQSGIDSTSLINHSQDSTFKKTIKEKPILLIKFDVLKIPLLMLGNQSWVELQGSKIDSSKSIKSIEIGASKNYLSNDFLKYSSSSVFARVGIDKMILDRFNNQDLNTVTLGVRLGIGLSNLSKINYTIYDPMFGNVHKERPAVSYFHSWLEIVSTIQKQIYKNFYLCYQFRGKVQITKISTTSPTSIIIAGYGKGDKIGIAGFNLVLGYQF